MINRDFEVVASVRTTWIRLYGKKRVDRKATFSTDLINMFQQSVSGQQLLGACKPK